MKKIVVVLSCEHAVNVIPEAYQALFIPFQDLLQTHRGIDFGALEIAKDLQKSLGCELVCASASRLLIDCNRSLQHRQCFSEATQHASIEVQQTIIKQYYLPFRQQVMDLIKKHIVKGFQVWHLSIHSFTPVMDGITRNADIGLLYNPKRTSEKNLAKQWQMQLKKQAPQYRVRLNYPYSGVSDGFTTAMRKQWSEEEYVGIELESNQALTQNLDQLALLKTALSASVLGLITGF